MRLAIVGSRRFTPLSMVEEFVNRLPPDIIILSGGAAGVDKVAIDAAMAHGRPHKIYDAKWTAYGRKAGPIRNAQIVGAADMIIAFWDGASPGTEDVIKKCKKNHKSIVVIRTLYGMAEIIFAQFSYHNDGLEETLDLIWDVISEIIREGEEKHR